MTSHIITMAVTSQDMATMNVTSFDMTTMAMTTPVPPLLERDLIMAIPYLILVTTAMVVGCVGNLLIIGAFIVNSRVRITGNEFALNLAIADLLVTVVADPFLVVGVTNGHGFFLHRPVLCEFIACVCLAGCICAFLTLSAVTFSRYIYVCHNQLFDKIFTRKSIIVMCLFCWVCAFLLESLNFIGWGSHRFDLKHNACVWDRTASLSYTIFLASVLIGGPISFMIIAYILILLKIRSVKRKVRAQTLDINQVMARHIKVNDYLDTVKSTKTFFLVLVMFIITWGPYALVNALDYNDSYSEEVHLYVSGFAHVHACINPIIYGLTNAHFKHAYKTVLCHSCQQVHTKVTQNEVKVMPVVSVAAVILEEKHVANHVPANKPKVIQN